jgi:hypothetical protein
MIMRIGQEDDMSQRIELNGVYAPSDDIVARVIEDELIIVPIKAGVGDLEDELFTLNETGRAIWDRLDGRRSLKDIASSLAGEFDSPVDEIEQDVLGLAGELFDRGIIVEVRKG